MYVWEPLAAAQSGMLAQGQLNDLGVSRAEIRNHLRVRRWAQRTSHVFSTTTGGLEWSQRLWLGVLHAGGPALVGGLTAAKVHGLRNWDREHVTVLVEDPLSFEPLPDVRFFRTRRSLADMRGRSELPLCRVEPAVLLFAAYEQNRRTAHGAVAAVVQQRLTDAPRLRSCLELMRPLRRAREFRSLLGDIDGGAHSLAEVDVRRACREFGIAPPKGQRRRRDNRGRLRYTDCEWVLADGTVVVLEIDGAFHDDVQQALDDRRRHRRLSTTQRIVISCSAYEIRHEPWEVMQDLIALGVPRSR